MSHQVSVERFFSLPVHEIYAYFTDPALLERWCAPDGMTLKVPYFEAQNGGRYRYEHTSSKGVFVCEGHIRRIVENESIRSVDDEILDPNGKVVGQKLACDITFRSIGHGTKVFVLQSGFPGKEFASECEDGWNQCLDKLQELIKESGLRNLRDRASADERINL